MAEHSVQLTIPHGDRHSMGWWKNEAATHLKLHLHRQGLRAVYRPEVHHLPGVPSRVIAVVEARPIMKDVA